MSDLIDNQIEFNCNICFEDIAVEYLAKIQCQHTYCEDCFSKYCTTKIQERYRSFGCPVCKKNITQDEIKKYVSDEIYSKLQQQQTDVVINIPEPELVDIPRCPICNIPYVRISGCPRVQCTMCRTNFNDINGIPTDIPRLTTIQFTLACIFFPIFFLAYVNTCLLFFPGTMICLNLLPINPDDFVMSIGIYFINVVTSCLIVFGFPIERFVYQTDPHNIIY